MDYSILLKQLGIEQEKSGEIIFSLSHRMTLSSNQAKSYGLALEKIQHIGNIVYTILLDKFIIDNLAKDSATVTRIHSTGLPDYFLLKFLDLYNLKQYMIYRESSTSLNDLLNLTKQLIGQVYLLSTYDNLNQIFSNIFDKSKLIEYNQKRKEESIDYCTILYNAAKRFGTQPKYECSKEGLDHDPWYTYKVFINSHTAQGSGNSKKIAKENCAKSFCLTWLKTDVAAAQKNELETNDMSRRVFKPTSSRRLQELMSEFDFLELEPNLLNVCYTQAAVCVEYKNELINNTLYASLGAKIKELYAFEYAYIRNNTLGADNSQSVAKYLNMYENIHTICAPKFKFRELINTVSPILNNEKSFETACNSILCSLFFVTFFSVKRNLFKNIAFEVFDSTLGKIDIRKICPSDRINKFTPVVKIVFEDFDTLSTGDFRSVCDIVVGSYSQRFNGVGKSKQEAKTNVYRNLIELFYEYIEPFVCGDQKDYSLITGFINGLLMSLDVKSTSTYINLWLEIIKERGLDIRSNSSFLAAYIRNLINNLRSICTNESYRCLSNLIFSIIDKQIVLVDNLLLDTFIDAIDKNFDLNLNWKEFLTFVKVLTEKKLLQKIEGNGLLIRNIKEPSIELQIAAVKSNIKSLYFIEKPDIKTIKQAYEKDPDYAKIYFLSNPVLSKTFYSEILLQHYEKLLVEPKYDSTIVLDNTIGKFDSHFRAIYKTGRTDGFSCAVGYIYKSGLSLIKNELTEMLTRKLRVRLLAGNLKNYNTNGNLQMDRSTAQAMNELISTGAELKTISKSFFHGKFYWFEKENVDIVVSGSTNLTRNAFRFNSELDSIFIYPKEQNDTLISKFEMLWEQADAIEFLDLTRFPDKVDNTYNPEESDPTVSKEEFGRRVSCVPDDELKARLNLWNAYNPDQIYDDLAIVNSEYVAFEYSERKMIVLDSFRPLNAYFVFYNIPIDKLKAMIIGKTKDEILKLSGMQKRGYHFRELIDLEEKIKSYF